REYCESFGNNTSLLSVKYELLRTIQLLKRVAGNTDSRNYNPNHQSGTKSITVKTSNREFCELFGSNAFYQSNMHS
ncbi:hypothetical protein GIB67_036536, partial [Kingdonia uniflora]